MPTTTTTADPMSSPASPEGVAKASVGEGASAASFAPALPDEAFLTQLANEMFAMLPESGSTQPGLNMLQPKEALGFAPSASHLRPSAHGASLAGAPAREGLPRLESFPGQGSPVSPSGFQTPSTGRPAAAISQAARPQPSHPGLHGATEVTKTLFPVHGSSFSALMHSSWPSPIPLPGEEELRSLLTQTAPAPALPRPGYGAPPAAPGSSFYFLDESRLAKPAPLSAET